MHVLSLIRLLHCACASLIDPRHADSCTCFKSCINNRKVLISIKFSFQFIFNGYATDVIQYYRKLAIDLILIRLKQIQLS